MKRLKNHADKVGLTSCLKAAAKYMPFPPYQDREAWNRIDPEVRRYYLSVVGSMPEALRPPLTATAYLEYVQNGNRSRYQEVSFGRRRALKTLLIAECLEGNGRWLNEIINGIWLICEESSWVIPAHNNLFRGSEARAGLGGHEVRALPDIAADDIFVDLFSAETASLLAWVWYFLHEQLDTVSPLVSQRILLEVKKRVIDPFEGTEEMWWMGFCGPRVNNWNPWINSNLLAVLLVLEEDPARRGALVSKCLTSLDFFIDSYKPDGGCDEGPGYWNAAGASLFDCLELVSLATEGRFNVWDDELIGNIGRYIQRVHIAGDWYVNFADGQSRCTASYGLIARYGQRIHDSSFEGFGEAGLASYPFEDTGHTHIFRTFQNLFTHGTLKAAGLGQPVGTAGNVWMDGLQVMVARENPESSGGFFLAAKGGHNAESHNHNDVGNFLVYHDGEPVLIDSGVEEYTAKNHGPQRYEIWTMQSSYHNLPEVNGIPQKNGLDFRATEVACTLEASRARLRLNLGTAYPPEAGIQRWMRTFELNRVGKASVQIHDQWVLDQDSGEVVLFLITNRTCDLSRPGTIGFAMDKGPNLLLPYDPEQWKAGIETIPLHDKKLLKSWGQEYLFRLRFTLKKYQREGEATWELSRE